MTKKYKNWTDSIPGSLSWTALFAILKNPIPFFSACQNTYGDFFKVRMIVPSIVMTSHDTANFIFNTASNYFSFIKGFYEKTGFSEIMPKELAFSKASLLVDGKLHADFREALNPYMLKDFLDKKLEKRIALWHQSVEEFAKTHKNNSVDPYEFLQKKSFQAVATILLDLDIDTSEQSLHEYAMHFRAILSGMSCPHKIKFPFGRIKKGIDARDQLVAKLLPPAAKMLASDNPNPLLQTIMRYDTESNFSDNMRMISLIMLLFASFNTTATTGSWMLYQLAMHPEWQEKLRAEQQAVIKDRSHITENELSQLIHHQHFVQEVLRMYPSSFFILREVSNDVMFRGHLLPKGTPIYFCVYLANRETSYFQQPDTFSPDRWFELNKTKGTTPHILTFGMGAHGCYGKQFAETQLMLILMEFTRYHLEWDKRFPPRFKLSNFFLLPPATQIIIHQNALGV